MPAITALPDMPTRGSATFSADVEALLGALPTFVSEANTLAAGLSNASTNSTSSSSVAVGYGSKSFTVETGKGYVPGTLVVIAQTSDATVWMYGEVTAYNSGTGALVVNVEKLQGSGTISAWTISLSGPIGDAVPQGGSIVSSAVNITLTNTSPRVQSISMTADAKKVTLPDPATLEDGGPNFILYKSGGYGFDIETSAGALVGRLDRSRFAILMLVDAASNAWRVAYADTDFAVGSGAAFNAGTTTYTTAAQLDATHFIVAYADSGNSSYGTACVLTVSGTTITAGAEAVFESANCSSRLSICGLSSALAVVCYTDAGNSSYLTACAMSISGSTITVGTPVQVEAVASSYIDVCALDSTHALVLASGSMKAFVLTVTGTSTAVGTGVAFNTVGVSHISVAALSSSAVIAVYQDGGNSGYGTARVLTISGTTITAGASEYVFSATGIGELTVAALSATKAAVFYAAASTSYGMVCVLDIAATVVTPGTPVVVEAAAIVYPVAAALGAGTLAIAWQKGGNTGYCAQVDIMDATAAVGIAAKKFWATTIDYMGIAPLTSTKFGLCWRDTDASNVGRAICIGA